MIDINSNYANRIKDKEVLKKKNIKNKKCGSQEEIIDLDKETMDTLKKINFANENIKKNNLNIKEEFNRSCSAYLRVEQFVDVDYKSEVSVCESLKQVLAILSLAFIDKDDYMIVTTPGRTDITSMSKMLGGKIYEYKLKKINNYLIDFEDIEENILKKCKILYINYPNNPTGGVANKTFFEEVVKYAKKYNFIVVHDATYLDLTLDDFDKVSFLNIEGAKEVGVELYDLSKTFNLGEYDIGFLAGNKNIIEIYNDLILELSKEPLLELQKLLIESLNNYENIIKENKEMYFRRGRLLKELFEKKGFKASNIKGGNHLYLEIPNKCNGVNFENAKEFALWLYENENILVKYYDCEVKFIKISLNFEENDEEKEQIIVKKIEKRLEKYKFE